MRLRPPRGQAPRVEGAEYEARKQEAVSLIVLSRGWAPRAGLAKGLSASMAASLSDPEGQTVARLATFEVRTLKSARATWTKWLAWMELNKLDPMDQTGDEAPLLIDHFIHDHATSKSGPRRLWSDLVFLKRRLFAPLPVRPDAKPYLLPDQRGQVAPEAQATVFEPEMLST